MPIDPSAQIASTARVHPDAVIGPGVRIGEYTVIEQDVIIGEGCSFEPHTYVKRWTTLGARNQISAGTVLGTDPLDKNFTGVKGEASGGVTTVADVRRLAEMNAGGCILGRALYEGKLTLADAERASQTAS